MADSSEHNDSEEPGTGFKNLMAQWNKRDEEKNSFVRLPGLDKKGSGSKKKTVKSDKKSKKEDKKPKESKSKNGASSKEKSKPAEPESTPAEPVEEEELDLRPPLVTKKSRKDLQEEFNNSTRSFNDKKKMRRQPMNVYQKTPEFKEGFKPPKFKKTDEEKDLIKKALRKNFVFAELTGRELRPLISAFEPCEFDSGDFIIKQHDPGDYFYIVQKGKVHFEVDGVEVGKAGKGSSFGELALLYTCPRAATVIAAKPTKVFRVDQATFHFILENQTAESEKEKLNLLKGVEFLKDLAEADLTTLTKVMTPRIFSEDDLLVKKGDPGDAFYVIQEGQVWIKNISVGSTTYEDIVLGPGQHFGERALITSEPRAANVVGKTSGVAFSINRSTFEKVLGGMSSAVMKANDAHLISGVKMFSAAKLDHKAHVQLADLITDVTLTKGQMIINKGKQVPAALYIVREGSVSLSRADGSSQVVGPGGYFGDETMLAGVEEDTPRIKAPYSVSAVDKCTIGTLTLSDCRYVFDTEMLTGRKQAPSFTLSKEELAALPKIERSSIKLEDLEKRTILGAGSFGQVWLATGKDDTTGETETYALKIQAKFDLYQERQIKAVIREKQLLWEISNPFIVKLVATYQDPTFIYFLTEFIQGGELFSLIHKEEGSGMEEEEAKFYSLGIADAIGHLHSMHIVYRDMKPENVLVDAQGYPKLVDFGFAKYCPDKTFTFCGTPGYVPPEIITKRGHDCSADNWSFGILLYEMVSGENPFYFEGMDQITLFRSIVEDEFLPLSGVSKEAAQIALDLLVKDPSMRLGGSKLRGFIVEHPWFANIDIDAYRRKEVTPPWKPDVVDPLDASCFDDWGDLVDKTTEVFDPIPEDQAELFKDEF
eukprot:CAMPEP_0168755392 /NCGR_PEP_ID=MMETSP0724-20121128/20044_1 /TAXON_ID=265536 /ORGANISM="Amphiprora sp., Strain CCMP467" /LENGTH=879 /DNA_ID=CAMNT_0008804003 /DNA_START=171 /DNA_END=2810 /DNA_ORIENTATION=+